MIVLNPRRGLESKKKLKEQKGQDQNKILLEDCELLKRYFEDELYKKVSFEDFYYEYTYRDLIKQICKDITDQMERDDDDERRKRRATMLGSSGAVRQPALGQTPEQGGGSSATEDIVVKSSDPTVEARSDFFN